MGGIENLWSHLGRPRKVNQKLEHAIVQYCIENRKLPVRVYGPTFYLELSREAINKI